MMLLIVGRTGSGKDYIAQKLENKGLKLVKSYSTRPKRNENEDSHIFITDEEAATFTNKVATTNIKGYEYFATTDQVNEADIYIIDPNGVKELVANMPEEAFHILYVFAENDERRFHAVKRADNKIKEEQIFEERDAAENEQFTEFETFLRTIDTDEFKNLSDNITCIYKFANTYNAEKTADYVTYIYSEITKFHRMKAIINESIELGIIKPPTEMSMDRFTDEVMNNETSMALLMTEYIRLSPRFNDIMQV